MWRRVCCVCTAGLHSVCTMHEERDGRELGGEGRRVKFGRCGECGSPSGRIAPSRGVCVAEAFPIKLKTQCLLTSFSYFSPHSGSHLLYNHTSNHTHSHVHRLHTPMPPPPRAPSRCCNCTRSSYGTHSVATASTVPLLPRPPATVCLVPTTGGWCCGSGEGDEKGHR